MIGQTTTAASRDSFTATPRRAAWGARPASRATPSTRAIRSPTSASAPRAPAASCSAGYACAECPSQGIDCSVSDAIVVLPNFFRAPDDDPAVARCPMRGACVGGRGVAGHTGSESSCAQGYTGPLCGICVGAAAATSAPPGGANGPENATAAPASGERRFFRSAGSCEPCPADATNAALTTVSISLVAVAVGVAIFSYLHHSHPLGQKFKASDATLAVALDVISCDVISLLSRLWQKLTKYLPQRLMPNLSSLSKIVVGYLQIMSALSQLDYVRWPDLFEGFLRGIHLDLRLELLPYDCVASAPLTHFERLLLNLLLPLICVGIYVGMNALSTYLWTRRQQSAPNTGRRRVWWHDLNTHALWSLTVWTLLLLYPSLCRATLEPFNCVELRASSFMASDTSIECDSDEWRAIAALSIIGIIVYVVGAPVGLWLAARRYHGCTDARVQRVALLVTSYTHECWYFEAVDLVRKLILASLVLLVWPGTRLQILFGLLSSGFFFAMLIAWQPYRDHFCGYVQIAAQAQVFFTYATATVLVRPLGCSNALHAAHVGSPGDATVRHASICPAAMPTLGVLSRLCRSTWSRGRRICQRIDRMWLDWTRPPSAGCSCSSTPSASCCCSASSTRPSAAPSPSRPRRRVPLPIGLGSPIRRPSR